MDLLFKLYHTAMQRRPTFTRLATSGALFMVGDFVTQQVTHRYTMADKGF